MGAHGEKRSVHFTSRLGLLALQRHHGLGSVNDRNVFSEEVSDFDSTVTTLLPPIGRGVLKSLGIPVSDFFFSFTLPP